MKKKIILGVLSFGTMLTGCSEVTSDSEKTSTQQITETAISYDYSDYDSIEQSKQSDLYIFEEAPENLLGLSVQSIRIYDDGTSNEISYSSEGSKTIFLSKTTAKTAKISGKTLYINDISANALPMVTEDSSEKYYEAEWKVDKNYYRIYSEEGLSYEEIAEAVAKVSG